MFKNIARQLCNAVAFSNIGNLDNFHHLIEDQEGGADPDGRPASELRADAGEAAPVFYVVPNRREP